MRKLDWVKKTIEENPEFTTLEMYAKYDEFKQQTNAFDWKYESYKRLVRKGFTALNKEMGDYTEDNYIKTQASNQRKADLNTQLRKENRDTYRLYNTIEDLFEEYNKLLKRVDLSKIKVPDIKVPEGGNIGILTIADTHINEVVRPADSGGNYYDFEVFAKRLKKYILKASKVFRDNKVKEVYIFMLGDLMNSPRRNSEKLSQLSSLTTASLLATHIFSQMLVELSRSFKIHISFCIGNESRITDEPESLNILSAENWDYLIFHNLRMMFRNKPIDFIVPRNPVQSVVSIPCGNDVYNALILHGHTMKGIPTNESIGNLLQNYSHQNIKINGVFLGHFHQARVSDFIQMTGSLKGGDSWTYNDRGFSSRASQNIYIINNDLSLDGYKIDLQKVEEESPSYELQDELTLFDDYVNTTKGLKRQ